MRLLHAFLGVSCVCEEFDYLDALQLQVMENVCSFLTCNHWYYIMYDTAEDDRVII